MGNPCRSAVEGHALNCGLMLTCGAAHRVAVNDGLASFTIFCCQKNVEAPPRRDALQPLGFASAFLLLPVKQADVERALQAVPVLVFQPMRARPARLHAAEGCAKARLFSRGRIGARNSHFSSNHWRVTTDAAVWRPLEPRAQRACPRQSPGVTTPLTAAPRSVVTPAASANPQGFSGINHWLT